MLESFNGATPDDFLLPQGWVVRAVKANAVRVFHQGRKAGDIVATDANGRQLPPVRELPAGGSSDDLGFLGLIFGFHEIITKKKPKII